jgi:AI-2 transport protein TqsA
MHSLPLRIIRLSARKPQAGAHQHAGMRAPARWWAWPWLTIANHSRLGPVAVSAGAGQRKDTTVIVRLRDIVHGTVLLLAIGWLLFIGRDIFVPVAFGALVVYVIVGLALLLARVPLVGGWMGPAVRHALSVAIIGSVLFALVLLLMANKERAVLLAPEYQQSLLATIQRWAVFFGIEDEPSWTTLRRDVLGQINLQRVLTTTLASFGQIIVTLIVVMLYATFLLIERRSFGAKLANLSDNPTRVLRIRELITVINRRIGAYLALKTVLSIFLGAVSWGIMAVAGLEFAALWAVLIAVLNFVPYIGSALGVLFPVLMSIVQFGDFGTIFWLAVALITAQFLIGNFLDPYLMANSLNLSPFAILISLGVWSQLWGVAGAFLAVPITAVMAIVFSEFPGTRPLAVLLSQNGRV